MDIAYDMEFLEDGRTIELISIGMVAADGRELYLINRDFDLGKLLGHEWLMANVVPSLPIGKDASTGLLHWNELHPESGALTYSKVIAALVHDFIQASADPEDVDPDLWGWYCAYDHVRLAQLWGPMAGLPPASRCGHMSSSSSRKPAVTRNCRNCRNAASTTLSTTPARCSSGCGGCGSSPARSDGLTGSLRRVAVFCTFLLLSPHGKRTS